MREKVREDRRRGAEKERERERFAHETSGARSNEARVRTREVVLFEKRR